MKEVNDKGKRSRISRKLLWISALAVLGLYAYNFEIIGENAEQSSRMYGVGTALREMQKADPLSVPGHFAWLTYAKACRNAKPRIAQQNCLHMVVEGPTMEVARKQVTRMAQVVRTMGAKRPDLNLTGVYLVLQPAVREEGYFGVITENSIGKFFETGDQVIVKIGE